MSDKKLLKSSLLVFTSWACILFFTTFLGLSNLPHITTPAVVEFSSPNLSYWIRWSNWDGGHFRGIAEIGYLPLQAPFFPLYPTLIKLLSPIFNSLWAGLLISYSCTILSIYFLYKLTSLEFNQDTSKKTVFLLLTFPTSFYLIAVYSESLFLLLSILSFYFSLRKQWFLAFMFASLTALTRFIGVVIIISIAIEYFYIQKSSLKNLKSLPLFKALVYFLIIYFSLPYLYQYLVSVKNWLVSGIILFLSPLISWIIYLLIFSISLKFFKVLNFHKLLTRPAFYFLLSFIPISLYLLYLYFYYGDPLVFIEQEAIIWHRQLSPPWQTLFGAFHFLIQNQFFKVGITAQQLLELLFVILFIILGILSWKRLRLSYTFYYILSLIIPLSTGKTESIHRYMLVVFPVFILLAQIKNPLVYQSWIILSTILLGILSIMFINGYWVT